MRSEQELTEIYLRHCKTVWNICYPYFMNAADTEDAVQDTFLHLAQSGKVFRDPEHEKAWLILTARNICRDELKKARRKNISLDAASEYAAPQKEEDEILRAVQQLPEQYRIVIYLHYYEGYEAAQIAQMFGKPASTIRSNLRRGRMQLKLQLGEEYWNEKGTADPCI